MFKIGVVEFECGHDAGGASYGAQTAYRVEIAPGSLAEANAMRWQLVGQIGDIVAVVWDDDPFVDGMYRQVAASVAPIANYLATGRMAASVTLERVPNVIEASYTLTDRAGGYTATDMEICSVHGYADASFDGPTWVGDTESFVMDETRVMGDPDGLAYEIEVGRKSWVDGTQVSVRQACNPKDYHIGRCRIEVNGGDEAGWWTLTGMTVPEGHDVRVSDGRVRVEVVHGEQYVLMQQWDGTAELWQENARYTFSAAGITTGEFNRRFKIERNDHASVEISCSMVWAAKKPLFVHLKMIRGGSVCWGTITSSVDGSNSATSYVTMAEYDGSNMATTLNAGSDALRRSAYIGTTLPLLHAEDTGITLSTSTDRASKTSSTFNLVGMGNNGAVYKTAYQLSDRLVY